MDEVLFEHRAARERAAAKALTKRGFDARFVDSAEAGVREVLSIIPPDAAVGCGGSVTVRQMGLPDRLRERGNRVVAHEQGMDPMDALAIRKEAVTCPCFLASANAVTLEGEIMNVDGIGNRVAGTIFGPSTVVIVAGANKIVEDLAAARTRIREYAAPANARRLGIAVPCVEAGHCLDCASEANICRVSVIMHRPPGLTDVKVILVPEELGF
jgi:hypothetical protein